MGYFYGAFVSFFEAWKQQFPFIVIAWGKILLLCSTAERNHSGSERHMERITMFQSWVDCAFKITVQASELVPEKALKRDEASFFSKTFWVIKRVIPRSLTASVESIWQQQYCEFAYSGQQAVFRPLWLVNQNGEPNKRSLVFAQAHIAVTPWSKDEVNKLTSVPMILHKLKAFTHFIQRNEDLLLNQMRHCLVSFVLFSVFQHTLSGWFLKPFLSQSVDVNAANS